MANFRRKLFLAIKRILKEYSRAAVAQVKQQWARYEVDYRIHQSAAAINFKLEDAEAIVTAAIVATGQKAWLLEYGKGSKMETDAEKNPFLEEYIRGRVVGSDGKPIFNPERLKKGLAMLGRPKGTWRDLDDYEHKSRGTQEGVDIEHEEGEKGGRYRVPKPPQYIIRKILFGENNDGIIASVNDEIQRAMNDVVVESMSKLPTEIKILRR